MPTAAAVAVRRGRSGPSLNKVDSLNLSLTIDNVFDKQPDFWSAGRIAGINPRFYNGIGRSYRLGLRMQF